MSLIYLLSVLGVPISVVALTIFIRDLCLPDKVDGLITSGEYCMTGYKQGWSASVPFIHHQDYIQKSLENPPHGLDTDE